MNPPEWHPWMDDAACAELPPDMWFADTTHWADTRKAIEVCDTCPVKTLCADYGRDEKWGVYGGLTARDRAAQRRREVAA